MSYLKKINQYAISEWPAVLAYSFISNFLHLLPRRLTRSYDVYREMIRLSYRIRRRGGFNLVSAKPGASPAMLLKRKSSDPLVFRQVFIEREYQPLLDILDDTHPDCKYIVDAGANIGCFSLQMKMRYPAAHVVALEPEKAVYRRLLENAKLNNCKIEAVNKGLWNAETYLAGERSFRDGEDWSFHLREAGPHEDKAFPVTDIRSVMKQHQWPHIDLLKIDVEGGEREIFGIAGNTDAWLPKVKIIAIEIHDEFNCRAMILESLHRNDFTVIDRPKGLTIGVNKKLVQS